MPWPQQPLKGCVISQTETDSCNLQTDPSAKKIAPWMFLNVGHTKIMCQYSTDLMPKIV